MKVLEFYFFCLVCLEGAGLLSRFRHMLFFKFHDLFLLAHRFPKLQESVSQNWIACFISVVVQGFSGCTCRVCAMGHAVWPLDQIWASLSVWFCWLRQWEASGKLELTSGVGLWHGQVTITLVPVDTRHCFGEGGSLGTPLLSLRSVPVVWNLKKTLQILRHCKHLMTLHPPFLPKSFCVRCWFSLLFYH